MDLQIYCNNQGVVKNTSIPVSTLSKKHNAVNYHIVREAVAAEAMCVGKEDTNTKSCYIPYSRKKLLVGILQYDY